MSEKFYVVSESELLAVKGAHAAVYEMDRYGTYQDIEDSLEDLAKAEAACRARPVPDEGIVKELYRLDQENRAMRAVVEAAIEEFNYKTQTNRISFPKFTRALAALEGDRE